MAEGETNVSVGLQVRAARLRAGLSLRELARRVGVSAATLSACETGRTGISIARLHVLADEIGVPITQLLVRTDERPPVAGDRAPAPADDDWRRYGPLTLDPILGAALAAIQEKGYHGCTVRDIADRARLSVPGIYHHHRSKQDMLVALFDLTMDDLLRRSEAARAEGSTAARRFALIVESLALFHTHRRDLGFLGATEMRSLLPRNRRRIAALRVVQQRMIDREVEAAIAAGDFSTRSPHEAARAVVTMCTALPQWFDPNGPSSPQDIAGLYVEFALDLAGYDPSSGR